MKRKDWWLPVWTLALSAAARSEGRTGYDFAPMGEEPPQFKKYRGLNRPASSEEG